MRNIFITVILLAMAIGISVMYLRNLNPPGQRSVKVMGNIPEDAALIFEFKNDPDFYDLFTGNPLLTSLIGNEKSAELKDLKSSVLDNANLKEIFNGQSIFVSIHPQPKLADLDFLITTSSTTSIGNKLDAMAKQKGGNVLIHDIMLYGKKGYNIYLNDIKRRFYLMVNDDNSFSASFSQKLVESAAKYRNERHDQYFAQLSDQQSSNSIANLYVNYKQLSPLFDQLFKSKNSDIFRSFRLLSAIGAFSLNYKSDALMFNGISHLTDHEFKSYLDLFKNQLPAANKLKSVFPATTAYSLNFALSNTATFGKDLLQWQSVAGLDKERTATFNRIKRETSIALDAEFMNLLGNEFAVVTTRYQEKIAIVQLKNGLNLRPFMVNISNMITDDIGEFKYDKLPLFLLGDAFSVFRRPYFMIADNYLIMCNSQSGITEYFKNYTKGNLLSKADDYIRFDNLQADQSNVSFFINFKNANEILKESLKFQYAKAFGDANSGWNKYYGASYQITASEKDFYTNFYIRLNTTDSTSNSIMKTKTDTISSPAGK